MTSAECIQYIIDNLLHYVEDRIGSWDNQDDPFVIKVRANMRNPKKWVRRAKFKLGSETDLNMYNFSEVWPELEACTARIFQLKDADSYGVITVIEKDGQIVAHEDLSD